MKGSIVAPVLLLIYLALSASPTPAQESVVHQRARIPFVRAGLYLGRTGVAKGPGAYLEINPFRWLGFCAILSHSHTTHEIEGGRARVSDLTAGGCITAHFPEIKGFLISPFIEMAHQKEHDRFTIPLDDGTTYHDGSDGRHRALLVGPAIDRAITKNGPRLVFRPAAKTDARPPQKPGPPFSLEGPIDLGRTPPKKGG